MADQPNAWFDTFTANAEPQPDAPTGKSFVGVGHHEGTILLSLCTADGQMLTCGLGKDGWNKLMFSAAKHINALGDVMTFYDAEEAPAPPTIN